LIPTCSKFAGILTTTGNGQNPSAGVIFPGKIFVVKKIYRIRPQDSQTEDNEKTKRQRK
jgi:hypothetical protein